MTAIDTLLAIRTAGGTATIDDGRLVVDIEVDLPESVWQAVAEHRDEIVRLLAPAPAPEPRRRPKTILAAIRNAGGNVTNVGDRLVLDLPDDLDEQLLTELDRSRDDVLAHLQRTDWEDPFPRHRDRHDLPAGVDCCDRCGATETVSSTIHGGESVRQDCARCGRHRRFSRWYGKEMP
jgi:hypothetical protein